MTKNAVVKVQTWGTRSQKDKGILNFLRAEYRGENPGHTSLEMHLPCTPEHDELIKKFCDKDPRIPYTVRIEGGGIREKKYVIRFSFIPSNDNKPFILNETYKEDTMYERTGHNTTARHYLQTSELEGRQGKKRLIHLFPACSLTEKGWALDFSSIQGQYILKQKAIANCKDLLNTVEFLNKKKETLKQSTGSIRFHASRNKSILLAAKRIGLSLDPQHKVSGAQVDTLLDTAQIQQQLREKLTQLLEERNRLWGLLERTEEKRVYKNKIQCINAIKEILVNHDVKDPGFKDLFLSSPQLSSKNLDFFPEIKEIVEGLSLDNLQIDREQTIEKLESLSVNYNHALNTLNAESAAFFELEEDYLCYGRPADNEVQLPLGSEEHELNAAAMLEQMRKIVDSGFKYDLYTHHCSSTALSILKAGRAGKVAPVVPAKIANPVTPQTVHHQAMALRNKVCKVSAHNTLTDLDDFYKNIPESAGVQVIASQSSNLYEAILNFAVNNLFPEEEDKNNKVFYVFSEQDKKSILKHQNELLPTQLLRDLWGIIPYRTLPLVKDGTNQVVIGQGMTLGELIHGLTILAKNNAESRISLQQHSSEKNDPHDPYEILKEKIVSEITRVGKGKDEKSLKKAADLAHAYTNIVEALEAINPSKTSKEKCCILFNELTPLLKVNVGYNLREATSYQEVKKTAIKLGIVGTSDYTSKYRNIMRSQKEEAPSEGKEFNTLYKK